MQRPSKESCKIYQEKKFVWGRYVLPVQFWQWWKHDPTNNCVWHQSGQVSSCTLMCESIYLYYLSKEIAMQSEIVFCQLFDFIMLHHSMNLFSMQAHKEHKGDHFEREGPLDRIPSERLCQWTCCWSDRNRTMLEWKRSWQVKSII